ncbi:cyclic nucleotide-binding domain-containing protein [Pseudenhygromyxa sp. WMMC2535]|uniref:cyclic nucleotide-binding domain-containing protein n=1 Tax=Pseudenhygromyxa sp. WMMC2535 TaxID=2712867 RepID=UPI001556044C|nr:cyclic nucleotide-binding domain-containing protein [Pseudenhygromyxa sp. WMMC2535]NVB40185.1 cyclic nucleotide-binding domain-containing protein [Pseudenhygromyxa sp. WMMC2535]
MTRLDYARVQLELLTRRFEAFEIEDPRDYAACVEIIDEVRRWELRRMAGRSALESSGFDEQRARTIMLAVRERRSGEIIGAVRGVFGESVADDPEAHREYRFDLLPQELLVHTGIAARMVIRPSYRKSAASLVLTRKLYEISLRRYGMQLFCVSCEPALLGLYQRMGYRPLARVWAKPGGGYRVPTLLAGYDEAGMAEIGSPLLSVLREVPRPWPREGLEWFERVAPQLPRDCGVRYWNPELDDPLLTDLSADMSTRGRRELLTNAVCVDGRPGDLAFCEGDGVRGVAVVLAGAVEARLDGRPLAQLGPGEVFGAVTTTLDRVRHASLVVLRPDTRLLFLSRSAFERVRDADDRAALWRNVARTLAGRVVSATRATQPSAALEELGQRVAPPGGGEC